MKLLQIKGGLIAGLLTILIFLGIHAIDPRWMLSPVVYWGTLLIYLLTMLGVCLLQKRNNGGILTFKQALRSAFSTFLITNLLFFAFYYFLFNYYDPGLEVLQKELSKEFLKDNYTGNQLTRQLATLEKNDFSVTYQTLISGYGYGAIGGFIISLILAVLVKEEP